MRIPKESLEEFLSGAAVRKKPEPPVARSLRPTGEATVLKPLAPEEPALEAKGSDTSRVSGTNFARHRNRSTVFGRPILVSGAVALSTLIVGAAIYLGFIGPTTYADLAENDLFPRRQSERVRTPPKITIPVEIGPAKELTKITDEPTDNPVVTETVPVSPNIRRAAYQPQPTKRRIFRPRLSVTNFVPTTLVIYAENGKIKTRVEPQLTATYKKPSPLPN